MIKLPKILKRLFKMKDDKPEPKTLVVSRCDVCKQDSKTYVLPNHVEGNIVMCEACYGRYLHSEIVKVENLINQKK